MRAVTVLLRCLGCILIESAASAHPEFSSGSVVQYSGVSPEVHRRFMSSPSPGSFYQDQIEENFSSRKIR